MNKAKHTLTREIECLLNDNHQKGKMMILITKTSGSQVDSPVAEGKRKEGGGRKIAHNSAFQIPYQDSKRVSTIVIIVELSRGKREIEKFIIRQPPIGEKDEKGLAFLFFVCHGNGTLACCRDKF